MSNDPTYREQAYQKLRAVLGEAEVSAVEAGELYRWTLRRDAYQVNMYITMDSPEHKDLAHIMISDGPKFQAQPVVSFLLYTIEDLDLLINRILKQWRGAVAS